MSRRATASPGQPLEARERDLSTALVTRSNGLERLASDQLRQDAAAGTATLSWRYPLYHGGFRLWEVDRSLTRADGCVVVNDDEVRYVTDRLGIAPERVGRIEHGLDQTFLANAQKRTLNAGGIDTPIRLCWIGSWLHRKGADLLGPALAALKRDGLTFDLKILGSGVDRSIVMQSLPPSLSPRVEIVPHYSRTDLPELLSDREILLFPSRFEGFGLSLVEAMACGVYPVVTQVGVVPRLIVDGQNGTIVPIGSATGIADAIRSASLDREALLRGRLAARGAVGRLTWAAAAERTLTFYTSVRERLARADHPRRTRGALRRSSRLHG